MSLVTVHITAVGEIALHLWPRYPIQNLVRVAHHQDTLHAPVWYLADDFLSEKQERIYARYENTHVGN